DEIERAIAAPNGGPPQDIASRRALQRIEDLDQRAAALECQSARLSARISALPEPRLRFGRDQNPHAVELASLHRALTVLDRPLHSILEHRELAQREVISL